MIHNSISQMRAWHAQAAGLVLLDLLLLALPAAGGVDTHLANDGFTVVEIQPPAGHVFTFGEDSLDMMLRSYYAVKFSSPSSVDFPSHD